MFTARTQTLTSGTLGAGVTLNDGNDAFASTLRLVNARLEAACETTAEARRAIALAIVEDVARFVLDWQEGSASVMA